MYKIQLGIYVAITLIGFFIMMVGFFVKVVDEEPWESFKIPPGGSFILGMICMGMLLLGLKGMGLW